MNESILLVDDEKGICKVLGLALDDLGYEVHTAMNGEEALCIFDRIMPPIVITDIKMPGMDGIQLLRALKHRNAETEVIMITGHGEMDLAIRSLKSEATDFITKPIHEDALQIAIKRARERIAMRRQLRAYTENLEHLVWEKTQQLLEAERLAAVGETVAGLSHAIKNIASGLKGGAFVLEKGLELENRQYLHEGWELLKGNVAKITRLSLDLLDFTKASGLAFTTADPNQPVREVYALMQAKAEHQGITLHLKLDDTLPPIRLDPEGIHRCLLNLVTNAMEAFPPNDPVSEPEIRLETIAGPRDTVEYRVRDNGSGMDEAVCANLFKTFFTTKGSRGTGIGLMLTRKIVDAHGGSIKVLSKSGQGTEFKIRVPIREDTETG